MRRLLKVPVAAEWLGLSEKTLRFWIWQGKIEVVRVGRAVRISEDVVRQLIERGTVPARRG
jgi:excisionase family DNA binding protein